MSDDNTVNDGNKAMAPDDPDLRPFPDVERIEALPSPVSFLSGRRGKMVSCPDKTALLPELARQVVERWPFDTDNIDEYSLQQVEAVLRTLHPDHAQFFRKAMLVSFHGMAAGVVLAGTWIAFEDLSLLAHHLHLIQPGTLKLGQVPEGPDALVAFNRLARVVGVKAPLSPGVPAKAADIEPDKA